MYNDELRRLLPEGADVFDAHLHLGHDIDGMVGDYVFLLDALRTLATKTPAGEHVYLLAD